MKKIIKVCKICKVKINKTNSLNGTFLTRHSYYKRCSKCIKIFNQNRYKLRNVENDKIVSKRYRKKNWPLFLLNSAKRNRKTRQEKKVSITKEWIKNQYIKQNKRCYWTNVRFYLTTDDHPLKPSLDRLIVNGPYSKNNTVLSLKSVNFGRNENSFIDLKIFLKEVVKQN